MEAETGKAAKDKTCLASASEDEDINGPSRDDKATGRAVEGKKDLESASGDEGQFWAIQGKQGDKMHEGSGVGVG